MDLLSGGDSALFTHMACAKSQRLQIKTQDKCLVADLGHSRPSDREPATTQSALLSFHLEQIYRSPCPLTSFGFALVCLNPEQRILLSASRGSIPLDKNSQFPNSEERFSFPAV